MGNNKAVTERKRMTSKQRGRKRPLCWERLVLASIRQALGGIPHPQPNGQQGAGVCEWQGCGAGRSSAAQALAPTLTTPWPHTEPCRAPLGTPACRVAKRGLRAWLKLRQTPTPTPPGHPSDSQGAAQDPGTTRLGSAPGFFSGKSPPCASASSSAERG